MGSANAIMAERPSLKRKTFTCCGTLKGMGRFVLCTVMGTREQSAASGQAQVVAVSILEEPEDLPDGAYVACFSGQSVEMQRLGGLWICRSSRTKLVYKQ